MAEVSLWLMPLSITCYISKMFQLQIITGRCSLHLTVFFRENSTSYVANFDSFQQKSDIVSTVVYQLLRSGCVFSKISVRVGFRKMSHEMTHKPLSILMFLRYRKMFVLALLQVNIELNIQYWAFDVTKVISSLGHWETSGLWRDPAVRPEPMRHILVIHAYVLSVSLCWQTGLEVCSSPF